MKHNVTRNSMAQRNNNLVTYDELRAEGVLEVGAVAGTALVFAVTEAGIHIFHAKNIEDRPLDDYAIQLAINWFDAGFAHDEVARNLGVDYRHLAAELAARGYERMSLQDFQVKRGADDRVRKEKRKRGNRRGSRIERRGGRFHFTSTMS